MTTEYKVYGCDDYGHYSRVCSSSGEVKRIAQSGTVDGITKIDTNETRWSVGYSNNYSLKDWEDNSDKHRDSLWAACVDYNGNFELAVCVEENVTEARKQIADHYGWPPTTGKISTLRKIGTAELGAQRGMISGLDYYDYKD